MFTKSAAFYDAIYKWKDYAAESEKLYEIIQAHKKSSGKTLLDVACGTGGHIPYLCGQYKVEGLDLETSMLDVARKRHPDIPFHEANMTYFDLGKEFDILVCLFSSIGYVKTVGVLVETLHNFQRHIKPGGVIIVEPWLDPATIKPHTVHASYVDEPELKIARINTTEVRDNMTIMSFHYLVGTPDSIDHFTEHHELGNFTREQYMHAFQNAGFDVTYDPDGLMGRGLFIGVRPL